MGPGTIRTKEKCPVCSKRFTEIPKIGFICSKCKTTPKRFFVDLIFRGQRIKIYSHRTGRVLDSYGIALETLERIRSEIREHVFDPTKWVKADAKRFYISTLLDIYMEYKIESLAPSYKSDFKRHLNMAKKFFGIKDIRDLRKIDIINYQRYLQKLSNFSAKTIKNILDTFKAFLNYCYKDIEVIPSVPSFPKIEVTPKPFKWLSLEDQGKFYSLIPDQHKPIFAFLMLHGCRPSEARALKCKDINLKNSTITISATFSGSVYREKRKGIISRPVTIPIHPEIYDYIAYRVKNNLPEAFVFINPNTGKYYNKNTLQKIWTQVKNKIGIRELRLYEATRHSFASNLINTGTSIYKVSKLLGHSNITMTEKYAHTNIGNLKADLMKLSLKTVPRLSPEEKSEQKIIKNQ